MASSSSSSTFSDNSSADWWLRAPLSDIQLAIIDRQTSRRVNQVEKLLRKFEINNNIRRGQQGQDVTEECDEMNVDGKTLKLHFLFPRMESDDDGDDSDDDTAELDEAIEIDRRLEKSGAHGRGDKDQEEAEEGTTTIDPLNDIPPYFRFVPLKDEKLGKDINEQFSRRFHRGKASTSEYMVELDEQLYRQSSGILRDSDRFLEQHSVLNNLQGRALAPNINKKYEKMYNEVMNRPSGKTDDRLVYSEQQDESSQSSSSTLARPNLGKKWFYMEAPHMTPELKQDLMAIKLMHVTRGGQKSLSEESELSEKRLPKFFQIGTMVEGPTEYYSERTARRDRKRSVLDQIIHDQSTGSNYINERYKEIQSNLDSVHKRKKRRIEKVTRRRMNK